MATYNAEMNRRVYEAAARLADEERRRPRGAFWGSIHGTLNHLLWADRVWMHRLADWPNPGVPMKDSPNLIDDFHELDNARQKADRGIITWAVALDERWLEGDFNWFSGAVGRELTKPRSLIVMHVFNHQTHHRGQVHAMLTAAGEKTGDTDLPFILPES
jgi:uncharacterized damage-inducible protein DinB